MSASKLKEIFVARGFSPFVGRMPDVSLVGMGVYSVEAISGADIFIECSVLPLIPNEPPVFVRATIPGTNRRPLKPWQLCSEAEKVSFKSLRFFYLLLLILERLSRS